MTPFIDRERRRVLSALGAAGFASEAPPSPGRTLAAISALHSPAYVARVREAAVTHRK